MKYGKMRFISEIIVVINVLVVLGLVSLDAKQQSLNEVKFAESSHILNKLSKIGRARRLPASQPSQMPKKSSHAGDEEVEFMYLDPEWSRKKEAAIENDDTEKRRKEAEEILIANKEKIKLGRGFQQINSIYKSLKRGDRIYGNTNINTIRFIPAIKGLIG